MARERSRATAVDIPVRHEDLTNVPGGYEIERPEADAPCRIILDLCGGSGAWSEPYRLAGYDVRVIDPVCDTGDVRELMYLEGVRGVLAAPPCDTFSRASARYWRMWGIDRLLEALSVVDACLRVVVATKPVWWALENPPGRLGRYLGPPVTIFDPYEFGDPWTKRTYLWGRFTRPARGPVVKPKGSIMDLKWRPADRARTPPGFARAFFEANP